VGVRDIKGERERERKIQEMLIILKIIRIGKK